MVFYFHLFVISAFNLILLRNQGSFSLGLVFSSHYSHIIFYSLLDYYYYYYCQMMRMVIFIKNMLLFVLDSSLRIINANWMIEGLRLLALIQVCSLRVGNFSLCSHPYFLSSSLFSLIESIAQSKYYRISWQTELMIAD